MRRFVTMSVLVVLALLVMRQFLLAQTGGGSLRGYVKDEQGGVLPGVAITAASPSVATPYKGVTDAEGLYRLNNLSPGVYSIAAELDGFATFIRQNVVVGAALNLDVGIVMKLRTVAETVTVVADSPLLETSKAGQAVNVSGEMVQAVPLAARRHWSEYLRFTPGAVVNDGTQNQAATFYFHGAGFNSYETTIDGSDMSSAQNPWPGYSDLPAGTISDIQVGTNGLDAATPLGFGEASNVVTKSGTDSLHGEGTFAFTPKVWTGTNTPGGTSQYGTLIQPEIAAGGPLQTQRIWFFGSFRYRSGLFGIGRPAAQVTAMEAIDPAFGPFDKNIAGPISFFKVTEQINSAHRLEGFVNRDTTTYDAIGTFDTGRFEQEWIGGWGASGKLSSVWANWLASQVTFSWNNKSFGRSLTSTAQPSLVVYQAVNQSSGRLTGVTQLANMQNDPSYPTAPYWKWNMRADFTAHRAGWLGTHDIQFGTWVEQNHFKNIVTYPANGFSLENDVLKDPKNPAGGYTPFYRLTYDGGSNTTSQGSFNDYAGYIQDAWRPAPRVSITGGLRIDKVKRHDDLFQLQTQNSTEFGPRVGVNYMLTSDERNAIRASFMRVADAPSINQLLFAFGTNTLGFTEQYALKLDGNFNTTFITPTSTVQTSNRIFDPNYSQPIVDEWTVGYRRQLPHQTMVDVGFIHRAYVNRPALLETNATYNGNVFTGYANVSQNSIAQLTNDIWNYPIYRAFEVLVTTKAKQFQVLGSYTDSWSELIGTWQPGDPASFITPNAFPFSQGLGSNDNRSAASANGLSASTGDPGWTPQITRLAVVYNAPWNLITSISYSRQSGLSSGPILTQIAAADPQFGPPTVTLSNGRVVSNPLATTIRFANPTRSDGQYHLPALNIFNARVGRQFPLSHNQKLEIDANIFNIGNFAGFQGFLSGANQLFSANYGQGGNIQQPVSGQLSIRYLF
jgi:hypothetical protein